jgi:hypothetical protein
MMMIKAIPILVAPIVTVISAVHEVKARSPMIGLGLVLVMTTVVVMMTIPIVSTLVGIVMDANAIHEAKAYSPKRGIGSVSGDDYDDDHYDTNRSYSSRNSNRR